MNIQSENDVLEVISRKIEILLGAIRLIEEAREKEERKKEEERIRVKHYLSPCRRKEVEKFVGLKENLFNDFSTFCESEVVTVNKLCTDFILNIDV